MRHTDSFNIEVCQDCLLYLANGDLPEDSDDIERLARMRFIWPVKEGWHITLGHLMTTYPVWHEKGGEPYNYEAHRSEDYPPHNPEPSFSWNSCDGCGTKLGGNRYAACASRTRLSEKI